MPPRPRPRRPSAGTPTLSRPRAAGHGPGSGRTPAHALSHEEAQARLAAAAEALRVPLSPVQRDQLTRYLDLLLKWNRVYNLTAVRDPAEALTHHLLDSLAIVPSLRRRLPGRARLLDAGSGGGLPGVVLAIACLEWDVTCVDAVAKKATFIQQVAAELALPHLHGVHSRVESLPSANADLIVSRAFASLRDFTTCTAAHLAPGGTWVAMKGKEPLDEMRDLPPGVEVFHVEHLAVPGLEADRCLVWLRPAAQVHG